jgi:hypothetical protein
MPIDMPITVKKITYEKGETLREKLMWEGQCGDMVMVRPCAEKYEGKTFLGVLLGDIALSMGCQFFPDTGEMKIFRSMYNPAIFIPDCNAVVFGAGSWWGRIESEGQLRQITDNDIANVWYVKALKQINDESTQLPNHPAPPESTNI